MKYSEKGLQSEAKIHYLECTSEGELTDEELQKGINERTRLVAVAQVSNVLGCVNPIQKITEMAHRVGAVVVVDGAQSVPHMPVDVQALDADFLAFSGNKLMGPMGIGCLYGKRELLEKMPPFLTGGGNGKCSRCGGAGRSDPVSAGKRI